MDSSHPTSKTSPESFDAFFRQHYPRILKYLRCRVATVQEAEDLAQDTFFAAAKSFHQPGITPSLAWLITIADSKRKNHYRYNSAQKRDGEASSIDEQTFNSEDHRDNHPEVHLVNKHDLTQLQLALKQLPEPKHSIFQFHFVLGYTSSEISNLMRLKLDTVKSHIRRARSQVLEYLDQSK